MKTIVFCLSVFFVLFWGNRVEAQVADSAAVVREVDSLLNISEAFIKKREYENALKTINSIDKIILDTFGEMSVWYAKFCYNKATIYYYTQKLSKAEEWWLKTKSIRENVLGKNHLDYAAVLNDLAVLYGETGNYTKSELLHLEAKGIRENVLGKEHLDYARSLNNLAELYRKMGSYGKAEPLCLEAKSIQEKVLGKEDPTYASTLGNLANLYIDMGKYNEAESLYLEAKRIREKVLGKENPTYIGSAINLASLYQRIGNYEKAEPLYQEAKEIFETRLNNRNHTFYLNCLNNLAILYKSLGNYEKAESLYIEVKNIREKALGKEHPIYASSLSNLAILYKNLGNYEKAEPLYQEAKAIEEKAMGKEHPKHAITLFNIANLYRHIGRYEEAELFYLEAKTIQEKKLGKDHADYAQTLYSLAILYRYIGRYEEAEHLFIEAKNIIENTLGKENSEYANSLNALAVVFMKMGSYKKSEQLFLEAKTIEEKVLGKKHPFYMTTLSNLAGLYKKMNDYGNAIPLYIESAQINQALIENATTHLSNQELQNYVKLYDENQTAILSVAFESKLKNTRVFGICYNSAVFYKGFLLNEANKLRNLSFSDSATAEQFNLLKSFGRRLAKEYEKPVAKRDSAHVADLEANSQALEKELTRTVAGFGETRRQVQWQEVRQALLPGEIAVEFAHFQISNLKLTDSTIYAALVLLPTDTSPHFIPLFEESQLSTLLSKTQSSTQSVGSLYAAARSGIVLDEIPAYGTELYNLIWKPLDSLLQGVKTVYFSPSGLLHRVNLAAIPVDSTAVLADKYTLRQMSSTRNLVVKTPEPVPAGYTAALFGGIRYNSDSTALYDAAIAMRGAGDEMSSRSTLEYTSDVQRDTAKVWTYLEGTRTEVDSLQRQMQHNGLNVKIFTGLAATEESFKALGRDTVKSPDILHIATHGFFFDDPEKRREQRFGDENVFRWNENPLFRSGLILAGADHAWQTGRPYANLEDGICTAYEISHLNLSNTKLAVLSACETGLGDIKGSEGVYGLQRAFKMAGVDYLIVSLWKVPDAQTVEFMDAFYRNWLGGETIHEAFAKAQQMMRQKYGVYEWGAWVLIE